TAMTATPVRSTAITIPHARRSLWRSNSLIKKRLRPLFSFWRKRRDYFAAQGAALFYAAFSSSFFRVPLVFYPYK
ncbi:MAG: hypothetical protein PUK79_05865, partial [Clostridiales bacterium]|nr:hypothetical protein [Clostridiales bacterium]